MPEDSKLIDVLSEFVRAYEELDGRIIKTLGDHILPLSAVHKRAVELLVNHNKVAEKQNKEAWSLHGGIDKVRRRYRVASDDDEFYQDMMEFMANLKAYNGLSVVASKSRFLVKKTDPNLGRPTSEAYVDIFLRDWSFQGDKPDYFNLATVESGMASRLESFGLELDFQNNYTDRPQAPGASF